MQIEWSGGEVLQLMAVGTEAGEGSCEHREAGVDGGKWGKRNRDRANSQGVAGAR